MGAPCRLSTSRAGEGPSHRVRVRSVVQPKGEGLSRLLEEFRGRDSGRVQG